MDPAKWIQYAHAYVHVCMCFFFQLRANFVSIIIFPLSV